MNLQSLKSRFRGEVFTPDSAAYEAARRIWNGMIDRRPDAIARCLRPEDVLEAVRFCVDQDINPTIRAGGHNVAGTAMTDGGLVIDVSSLKQIATDPLSKTAVAQCGLTWGEFDADTSSHGLATTGGVISTTGIAGLTLGGGIGWLMGRCGLVCDNTLAYEVISSEGQMVRATSHEEPDLFWALKGGGGNFGVVTSITYKLYPISKVVSGMLLYPLAEGGEVLRRFRDFIASGLPDELIVYAAAMCTPDGTPCMAIFPAYCGDELSGARKWIDLLKSFGTLMADMTAEMPYTAMQQMLDAGAPYGIRSYWKSNFLDSLPDAAIDVYMKFARRCPSHRTLILLEHSHGAAARVASDATAFPVRKEGLDLVIFSLWQDAVDDAENIAWTRSFYQAFQPWSAGSVYVNGMSEDDSGRVNQAYGGNFERLSQIKAVHDPLNRFRRNQNIPPGEAAAARV